MTKKTVKTFDPDRPPPVPPARRVRHWASGLLFLALGVAALVVLVGWGGLLLAGGLLDQVITGMSRPDPVQTSGMEGALATGAVMVATGLVLGFGLLVLGVRRLLGRPYPGRHGLTLFVVLFLGLVGGTALIARRATAPPAATTPALVGLDGLWEEPGGRGLAYRLNPDGTLTAWSSGLVGSGGGEFGTWTRTGPTVTVRTVRNWHVVATLNGNTLQGTMFESNTNRPLGPVNWVRTPPR